MSPKTTQRVMVRLPKTGRGECWRCKGPVTHRGSGDGEVHGCVWCVSKWTNGDRR